MRDSNTEFAAPKLQDHESFETVPSPQRAQMTSLIEALERGGLSHIYSLRGGTTDFALRCIHTLMDQNAGPPPLSLWVGDEGIPYPPVLLERFSIPLSYFVILKTNRPLDVWHIALDATQTGLFHWILLKPSAPCPSTQLRRLQLQSEKNRTKILILSNAKLPQWPIRIFIHLGKNVTGGMVPHINNASLRTNTVSFLGVELLKKKLQELTPSPKVNSYENFIYPNSETNHSLE